MVTATKTKYRTTEVNVKKVDRVIDRLTFNAICSTNHLTPVSEAAMENSLVPGSVMLPTRDEIIKRNLPDYIVPVENWDNIKPPKEAFDFNNDNFGLRV